MRGFLIIPWKCFVCTIAKKKSITDNWNVHFITQAYIRFYICTALQCFRLTHCKLYELHDRFRLNGTGKPVRCWQLFFKCGFYAAEGCADVARQRLKHSAHNREVCKRQSGRSSSEGMRDSQVRCEHSNVLRQGRTFLLPVSKQHWAEGVTKKTIRASFFHCHC